MKKFILNFILGLNINHDKLDANTTALVNLKLTIPCIYNTRAYPCLPLPSLPSDAAMICGCRIIDMIWHYQRTLGTIKML